jgi:hypothetical protein
VPLSVGIPSEPVTPQYRAQITTKSNFERWNRFRAGLICTSFYAMEGLQQGLQRSFFGAGQRMPMFRKDANCLIAIAFVMHSPILVSIFIRMTSQPIFARTLSVFKFV